MTKPARVFVGLVPVIAVMIGVAVVEDSRSDDSSSRACVTEFSGPTGGPGGLATGPDGKLWFSEQLDDRVGSFDPATHELNEIAVPEGTQPHFVARGPDGGIWFSGLGNVLGRVDPKTGRAEIFREGITPGSVPHAVAPSPDGKSVYFTEQEGGRLARFDIKTHEIVEFDKGLPPHSRPHGIAVDPDGEHLWVALQAADKIARFDRATGSFDLLVDFPTGSGPHDIRFGPDGHTLFVTLQGASELATYDPETGEKHEYAVPLPPPTVGDLVPAPKLVDVIPSPTDKAVWVTTFMGDRLFRFDTGSRRLTQITCGITPGSGVLEITLGPDGRLWFTEPLGQRLARLRE